MLYSTISRDTHCFRHNNAPILPHWRRRSCSWCHPYLRMTVWMPSMVLMQLGSSIQLNLAVTFWGLVRGMNHSSSTSLITRHTSHTASPAVDHVELVGHVRGCELPYGNGHMLLYSQGATQISGLAIEGGCQSSTDLQEDDPGHAEVHLLPLAYQVNRTLHSHQLLLVHLDQKHYSTIQSYSHSRLETIVYGMALSIFACQSRQKYQSKKESGCTFSFPWLC